MKGHHRYVGHGFHDDDEWGTSIFRAKFSVRLGLGLGLGSGLGLGLRLRLGLGMT